MKAEALILLWFFNILYLLFCLISPLVAVQFKCPGGQTVDTETEETKCHEMDYLEHKVQICKADRTKGCYEHDNAFYCCTMHCQDAARTPVDAQKDNIAAGHTNLVCPPGKEPHDIPDFPFYHQWGMQICCPKEHAASGETSASSSSSSESESTSSEESEEATLLHGYDAAQFLANCVDHDYCGAWGHNGFCENPFYFPQTRGRWCPHRCLEGCGHPVVQATAHLHQMEQAVAFGRAALAHNLAAQQQQHHLGQQSESSESGSGSEETAGHHHIGHLLGTTGHHHHLHGAHHAAGILASGGFPPMMPSMAGFGTAGHLGGVGPMIMPQPFMQPAPHPMMMNQPMMPLWKK